MNILTGSVANRAHEKSKPGSYEWWYFDGLDSKSDLGFTIIFYEGNPFSSVYMRNRRVSSNQSARASHYPALSISVYRGTETIYYGFVEHLPDKASFSRNRLNLRVGSSTVLMDDQAADGKLSINIHLDQSLPGGDRLTGDLHFQSDEWNGSLDQSDEANEEVITTDRHSWNLVQPRASVTGMIEIDGTDRLTISFDGVGYHDHNLGLEPMCDSFREWYWGRIHLNRQTLIYYIMMMENARKECAWLIDDKGRVRTLRGDIELGATVRNVFGLKSSRTISIESSDVKAFVQQDRLIDNGPFYQRFRSRLVLETDGVVDQGEGVTEYIHPGRIEWELFRPLVDMRIVYPGRKPHWVQRSPRLYRWTW